MLDKTNIHFKKAVHEIAAKAIKLHKESMVTHTNVDCVSIYLFLNDNIFYSDYVHSFESKEKIAKRMEDFRKMYYAWEQLQNKKGGSHV